MSKYVDAEKLKAVLASHYREITVPVITEQGGIESYFRRAEIHDILNIITSLQQEQDMGEVSDGYHTFNELYYYRMLYNAAFFNLLPKAWVHKSKRHHTGEECFGGGWFIVMANLPTGQISNHYELKDWDLFKVPEKEIADEWDGHTPQEATKRIYEYLQYEQPMPDSTQLIELWHKDKEMLEEKDFRDDQWRLAYNAYMCGFGRGVAVKKKESPEDICSCHWKPSKVQMKYLDIAIAEANGHKSYNLAYGLEKIKDDLKKL